MRKIMVLKFCDTELLLMIMIYNKQMLQVLYSSKII